MTMRMIPVLSVIAYAMPLFPLGELSRKGVVVDQSVNLWRYPL